VRLDPVLPQFAEERHSGVVWTHLRALFSYFLYRYKSYYYSGYYCVSVTSLIRSEMKSGQKRTTTEKLVKKDRWLDGYCT